MVSFLFESSYSIGKSLSVIADILASDIPNNSTTELFTESFLSLRGVLTILLPSNVQNVCNCDCGMDSTFIVWSVDVLMFIGSGDSNSWFVFILLKKI